jgi:hypothetical protein
MSQPLPTITLADEGAVVNLGAGYVEQALREWGMRHVEAFVRIDPARIAVKFNPDGSAVITGHR